MYHRTAVHRKMTATAAQAISDQGPSLMSVISAALTYTCARTAVASPGLVGSGTNSKQPLSPESPRSSSPPVDGTSSGVDAFSSVDGTGAGGDVFSSVDGAGAGVEALSSVSVPCSYSSDDEAGGDPAMSRDCGVSSGGGPKCIPRGACGAIGGGALGVVSGRGVGFSTGGRGTGQDRRAPPAASTAASIVSANCSSRFACFSPP